MSESKVDPADERLERLESQLVRIERILSIGFAAQVRELREDAEIGDEVSAEILRRTPTWTPAGELKQAVTKANGQSEPTVKRRFKDLVEIGALERRGQGTSTEYRNTGLFG
jgi:Fic family protein